MPWRVTDPMLERTKFVLAVEAQESSFSAVCAEFGISRETGYRWWRRYERDRSLKALEAHSRRPHNSPSATPLEVVDKLLAERQARPNRSARKLLAQLRRSEPDIDWPSDTTGHRILQRHGLVTLTPPPKRRGEFPRAGGPFPLVYEPNEVWTTDFKGQFRLGNRQWCYPLGICDLHSRFALACRALTTTATKETKCCFDAAFREYGLPVRIRSDNGTPFASQALCGLSQLSVWFLKLDIGIERTKPGRPQQNGQHERFNRTLNEEAANPPEQNMRAQQLRFDSFLKEFNVHRPHEALNLDVPADHYRSSPRPMPRRNEWPGLDYAESWERRQVRIRGDIKWKGGHVFITEALRGEPVALQPIGDSIWLVRFCSLILGVLREDRTFVPASRPIPSGPS